MLTLRGWVASSSTTAPTSPSCQASGDGWLLTVPLYLYQLHVNPQRVGGFQQYPCTYITCMSTFRGWVASSSTPVHTSPSCQPSEGGWLLAVPLYLYHLHVNLQRVGGFQQYPCTYITFMSTLRGWVASSSTPVLISPSCQPSEGGWLLAVPLYLHHLLVNPQRMGGF